MSVQAQVINLLGDLQQEFGLSYLFIAHDLAVVEHISHRVAVMYLGKIVEIADKAALFAARSTPTPRRCCRRCRCPTRTPPASASSCKGDVPSPINPPSGCRFHTRCPYAFARCSNEEPEMREVFPGHHVACHLREVQTAGIRGNRGSCSVEEAMARLVSVNVALPHDRFSAINPRISFSPASKSPHLGLSRRRVGRRAMRSTLERGLAAAISIASGHFSWRLVRRVKPARAMISLMMSVVVVALCAMEQARANDVTVTIMGQLTSGSDTTGVFGKPNPNLTGAPFTLVCVLNYMNGQSCGDNFSCIEQSAKYGLPMTTIMLTVNNGTPFLFGQFRPASIIQLASRQLNYRDLYYKTHAAYLVFNEVEDDAGSLSGSADVHANVYIDPTWAQQNWPQEFLLGKGPTYLQVICGRFSAQ